MNIETLAAIVHAANREYCISLDDYTQPPWEAAEQWAKDSAIAGIKALAIEPTLTPSQMHDSWLAHKAADGWTYGEEKDPGIKTHPCMVAYSDLPEAQQLKDKLFSGIVKLFLDDLEWDEEGGGHQPDQAGEGTHTEQSGEGTHITASGGVSVNLDAGG